MSESEGAALAQRIIDTVGPLVDGKPADLVIDAFASALVGMLAAGGVEVINARSMLVTYAEKILDYAEDPGMHAWLEARRRALS
jgi:hypothetical protein